MIKFEKVPFNEYLKERTGGSDITDETLNAIKQEWEDIKLPQRATSGSAGYDFFAPYSFDVAEYYYDGGIGSISFGIGHEVTVPTGIRFITDRKDICLICVPRSGLGFKYGTRLANTVGVIDSDYFQSENCGHIKVKMSADSYVNIEKGKGMFQGIIMPYLMTDDDSCECKRNGGFGSTDRK